MVPRTSRWTLSPLPTLTSQVEHIQPTFRRLQGPTRVPPPVSVTMTPLSRRSLKQTRRADHSPPASPAAVRSTSSAALDRSASMIEQSSSGVLSGQLQYSNHPSGAKVRSATYTSPMIVGHTATFDGTCTVNGAPCSFTVNVIDNGEPGATDRFTISVSGGPTEGGVLRSR